jgi:5-methylthioadenosine/S-adenosylhomocysteine deaminase
MLDGVPSTIRIRDGRIDAVEPAGTAESGVPPSASGGEPARSSGNAPPTSPGGERVVDARGLHAFPSFKNGHTHVPMVLFRGFGDDMPLMEWLGKRIWPAEKHLTADDVYLGTRLGVLEMIRGGTTFFNEMYWHRPAIVRAVREMGVRALVGVTVIDVAGPEVLARQKAEVAELVAERRAAGAPPDDPVQLALAPHSIYTVSPPVLEWIGGVAGDEDLLVHIHLSETRREVEECLREHGCRPAHLLDRLGLVGPRLIAAHGQYLDEGELELLGAAGATVVHNPVANLKLATGEIFPYREARRAGVRVCLGTDGAASNNNLDMIEEMKVAALVQKHREVDATVLPADEALAMATTSASAAFRLGNGRIEAGAPADLVLVDFSAPATQPLHDPVSALVYAANASNVHTTICGGRVLMHARRVEGCDEEDIVAAAASAARRLLERAALA